MASFLTTFIPYIIILIALTFAHLPFNIFWATYTWLKSGEFGPSMKILIYPFIIVGIFGFVPVAILIGSVYIFGIVLIEPLKNPWTLFCTNCNKFFDKWVPVFPTEIFRKFYNETREYKKLIFERYVDSLREYREKPYLSAVEVPIF